MMQLHHSPDRQYNHQPFQAKPTHNYHSTSYQCECLFQQRSAHFVYSILSHRACFVITTNPNDHKLHHHYPRIKSKWYLYGTAQQNAQERHTIINKGVVR